MEVEIR